MASTHFVSQVYPFALTPLGEVKNFLRTQCAPEEVARTSEIVAKWSDAQAVVSEIIQRDTELKTADKSVIRPIDEGSRAPLDGLAREGSFQRTFGAIKTTFELVEIDALVASQRTVDLDFVRILQQSFPKPITMADLIELCLIRGKKEGGVQHLEMTSQTHIFSSPSVDMRFLGCFPKILEPSDGQYCILGGVPVAALIAFIGYGLPCVNVYKLGGRLILNNGFHRVYALRENGVSAIPAVVQHVSNPILEIPPQVGHLPRDYLLRAPRPVLLKDFFDPALSLALKVKKRLKTVTVQIGLTQHEVPA